MLIILTYNWIIINYEVCAMDVCAVVMVAGKGSRMQSKYHKGTHKICGKEMINIIIQL